MSTRTEQHTAAEAVLRAASASAGAMVHGEQIAAAWPDVTGYPVPLEFVGRWRRALEPGIREGRVRYEETTRLIYYAPSDVPSLSVPSFGSDLQRVEEALRRAVERADSAVLVEDVRVEIDADPILAINEDRTSLAVRLQRLRTVGRCGVVRPQRDVRRSRVYFTTLGGPTWIRPASEGDLAKRWRACQSLWRASQGLPFTTSALRDYAEARPTLRIENDPQYGWANALQHLVRTAQIVVAGYVDDHFARFAPLEAWCELDEAERIRRLADRRGRSFQVDVSVVEALPLADASEEVMRHDVAATSRNRDIKSLIVFAKEKVRNSDVMAGVHPTVATLRPVSLQQLRKSAEESGLVKLKGADFIAAVHDAARVRPGMVRSAIMKIGTAGWTSYFDVTDNPAGRAYVDFVRLRRERHMPFLERETLAIEAAVDFSERGIAPASPYVLAARAAIVRWECDSRLRAHEAMQRWAPLRDDEQRWCDERSAALNELAGRAKVVRDSLPADAGPTWENANEAPRSALTASNDLIDIKDAWRCIEGQAQYALTEIRALSARFVRMVPLFTDESADAEAPRRAGRRVSRYMERVAFECYAAERWGTPEWAEFYVLAGQTLGLLRDPEPLVRTLDDSRLARCYEGGVAALTVLDSEVGREAMQRLRTTLSSERDTLTVKMRGLRDIVRRAEARRPFAAKRTA